MIIKNTYINPFISLGWLVLSGLVTVLFSGVGLALVHGISQTLGFETFTGGFVLIICIFVLTPVALAVVLHYSKKYLFLYPAYYPGWSSMWFVVVGVCIAMSPFEGELTQGLLYICSIYVFCMSNAVHGALWIWRKKY